MKVVAVINKVPKQEQEEEQEEQEEQEEEEQKDSESCKFIINPNLRSGDLYSDYNNHNYFDMREKDNQFLQLQQLIESKKNLLLKNQEKIKKISKQNDFLDSIKNDYFKYNNYIVKQKTDQMKALELLNEYIKELSESGDLSDQNIKDSRYEQKKILREIKIIKSTLDQLIREYM